MMAMEIKKIMLEKGLKQKDVATRVGWTATNFSNKLSKDDFSESELRKLAPVLGCQLSIELVDVKEL